MKGHAVRRHRNMATQHLDTILFLGHRIFRVGFIMTNHALVVLGPTIPIELFILFKLCTIFWNQQCPYMFATHTIRPNNSHWGSHCEIHVSFPAQESEPIWPIKWVWSFRSMALDRAHPIANPELKIITNGRLATPWTKVLIWHRIYSDILHIATRPLDVLMFALVATPLNGFPIDHPHLRALAHEYHQFQHQPPWSVQLSSIWTWCSWRKTSWDRERCITLKKFSIVMGGFGILYKLQKVVWKHSMSISLFSIGLVIHVSSSYLGIIWFCT